MVGGPAHGPRVDVVQLAARAWTPGLVAPSVLEELMLAIAHRSRNGAVIPHGDKRQPAQNTGDGHHVGYLVRLWLIQLLSPALASLPPPRGGAPAGQKIYIVYVQFSWYAYAQSLLKVCKVLIQFGVCLNMFWFTFCLVYILFDVCLHIVWTKFCLAHKNAFVPARSVVVQAIDQGAVAVHQHRPTLIDHLQLTNCSPKKSLCPMSRRLKT